MALLPLSSALSNILESLPEPNIIEQLPLNECINRVLADDIYSPINVPSFNNSAMDGYALRCADLAHFSQFKVIGKAFAGIPFLGKVNEGECVRIMTGAMIPEGADIVIMQEESIQNEDGSISFSSQPKIGTNIRQIGEDITQGSLVLSKGSRLNVSNLPLLASLGIPSVVVFRKIKVAVLSTGDELVSVGNELTEGKIYDTNRFAISLMLEKLNCEVLDYGLLPDNPAIFEEVFTHAQQEADVLITTGGVSVGEADFTKTVLEKLGEIAFWKIAMKPGKPFAFGKLENAWFFGLPGNPVSALVTFYQLVQPALLKMSGVAENEIYQLMQTFEAYAKAPFKKSVGRQDFQRGFFNINEKGQFEVIPMGMQGSHIFSAFNESNCFVVLETERANVAAGEKVIIQPFNLLLK